jgi:hypothetical protein
MRRTWILLLAGLSLACTVPAFALAGQEHWIGPDGLQAFDVKVKPRTAVVEILGTLDYQTGKADPKWEYATPTAFCVTVEGVTYYLDMAKDKALPLLAAAQKGQRVIVTGRLEQRQVVAGIRGEPGKPVIAIARVFSETWVTVTGLRPALADGVKETTTLEIRGKLDLHRRLGYPAAQEVPVIEVGGQLYVLNISDKAILEYAAKLDGKTLVIRGTKGPDRKISIMCQPPFTLPSIDVTGLEAPGVKLSIIELHGEFELVRALPHWFKANGTGYWFDFGKNDKLRHLAESFKDRHAIVRGVLVEGERPSWRPTVLVSDVQHDPDYVRPILFLEHWK